MSTAPWQKITAAYTYICSFRSHGAARRDRESANRARTPDAADAEKELADELLNRLRLLENSLDIDASKIKSEWNAIESSINSPQAKLAALRTLFTALSIQHSKLAKQHLLPVNLPGAATNIATPITVETSAGDLIDRLTILEIKLEHIEDTAKLKNVRHEYELLTATLVATILPSDVLTKLRIELKSVNELLWKIEDDIRDHERSGSFGESFVTLARSVYRTNDRRATLKRQINEHLGSGVVEEKSYAAY